MSSGDRNDRHALIVLALFLAFIVVVSFLGVYARHEANYQVGCYAASEVDQHGVEKSTTICPDDHLLFGDGMAQWVMALFALVATGVSWRALYLLRRTFIENKRTADATVDALEAQRAWLTFSTFNIIAATNNEGAHKGRFFGISIVWINGGLSPAREVLVMSELKVVGPNDPIPGFIVPASDEETGRGILGMNVPISPPTRWLSEAQVTSLQKHEIRAFIYSKVTYNDVFYPEKTRHTELCGEIVFNGHRIGPGGNPEVDLVLNFKGPNTAA